MNISEELVRSVQAHKFINPKSFQDIFTELFDIATTQLLIPLTHQNADAASQYCMVRKPTFISRLSHGY